MGFWRSQNAPLPSSAFKKNLLKKQHISSKIWVGMISTPGNTD